MPHLVLEKHRNAKAWRAGRWDSLVANGPAWHDRFPNLAFAGLDPESFAPKDRIASYLVAYAQMIAAPIRTGVEVRRAEARVGASGFTVETSAGRLIARRLVVATGAFQTPVTPALVPPATGIFNVIPLTTKTRRNCRRARWWWLAPGPPGCISPTN